MDAGRELRCAEEGEFACTVHRFGRTSEIVLAGEVDIAVADTLHAATETALGTGVVETVLVDLTRVTFADSTAVSWLISLDRRGRDSAGARLVAVTAPGGVRTLLQMTGLDAHITVVNDRRMR
jgi:anti-anti-sigma factor